MNKPKIAIIGAGISGILLAKNLSEIADVKIFEKARGVGGRMSCRYDQEFEFDHGVQCFTARSTEFKNFLKPFFLSGDVAVWQGRSINLEDGKITNREIKEDHLVAAPRMNSLCKKLADGLDLNLSVEVAPLQMGENKSWKLTDKEGVELGEFDFVISTAPVEQSINLLNINFESVMKPCFALMVGLKKKWQYDWVFARIHRNPIKFISINSSKPKRQNDFTSIVVHSNDDWAKENLEREISQVQKIMLDNFCALSGIKQSEIDYINIHRWRYALVEKTQKNQFCDFSRGLAATSDWFTNSRIEDVYLATEKLSKQIKNFYLNA